MVDKLTVCYGRNGIFVKKISYFCHFYHHSSIFQTSVQEQYPKVKRLMINMSMFCVYRINQIFYLRQSRSTWFCFRCNKADIRKAIWYWTLCIRDLSKLIMRAISSLWGNFPKTFIWCYKNCVMWGF